MNHDLLIHLIHHKRTFSPQLILAIILIVKLLIPLILKLVVETFVAILLMFSQNLIINLISQIDNLELKEKYFKKFKKTMIKDENDKKLKSKISLDETLERFNKKKSREITINDLQHEITIIKKEIIELKNVKNDNFDLKQEMLLLKIDKQFDNEQTDSESDEQKDEDGPNQQAPLSNTAPY